MMDDIPPFTGFPRQGLKFLEELEQNNNRLWFNEHKQDYLDFLLKPGQSFVKSLGERLEAIFPGIEYGTETSGRGSIMRIHRDIRFSKEKTPYNTRFRAFFWEGINSKKMENPGFFIGFDSKSVFMHAGVHIFTKPILEKYRNAVVDSVKAERLAKTLQTLEESGLYEMGGSHFKRVPRGYETDYPNSDLLLYNGLHATTTKIPVNVLKKPELVDVCYDHCVKMAPIHQWLVSLYN
ncbi:DUF2461 domain-containing protein [Candidatus Thorarchaeota archaeon]|jgi:uncharacterized protein (TIGR02453 family)|nr:MAG: DUF2461 domain-containing protein [Candidatus Thorarchaeota archaeon]